MKSCFKNLRKIEFVVTDACTGRCKHCSQGDHVSCIDRIDPEIATDAVRKICAEYSIDTVMTFGGEPLLHPEAVYAIIAAARDMGVQCRQVITNGYFTNSVDRVRDVAERLASCGVTDLLLSVDSFHQETIPISSVRIFAEEAVHCGIPIRLQPAWLVSADDENPYNHKTKEILDSFADMGLMISDGNVIFPEGNAVKYLSEYFADAIPENPYIENPCNVKCISFAANGDVLQSNVYINDIMDIMNDYTPCEA